MTKTYEDGPIQAELIPVAKGKRIGYQNDDQQDEKDAQTSDDGVNNAMQLVYRTAKRVKGVMDELGKKEAPGEFEIDFAIKIDENGDASIVHSGSAMHFRVKLKWEND